LKDEDISVQDHLDKEFNILKKIIRPKYNSTKLKEVTIDKDDK
jgi:hypothetical protein